jgi:hypothetical protein
VAAGSHLYRPKIKAGEKELMKTQIARRLKTGLAVAAAVMLPGALGVVVGLAGAPMAAAQTNDLAKFAGTYALITTEVKDAATGKWSQTPNFNSNGYIIYSNTGQMAVHIMPKIRERSPNPQTGEGALAAMRGYTMYFGSYTVDDKGKFVVHHRVGMVNPASDPDYKRYYDFVMTPQGRERLILTPESGGGKEKATNRLIWERQQFAPLSAEQKKFVGFWKLLYTDDYRTKDGKEVFHGYQDKPGGKNTTRAGTSYIIYTESGHMMVILMANSGRTGWVGAQPTPEEALKAWTSIGGYFGRFITYENQTPQYVIHSQQGSSGPGTYSEQQRFYQFTGDVLRLGAPPVLNAAGEMAGGHLYWQKMKAGER